MYECIELEPKERISLDEIPSLDEVRRSISKIKLVIRKISRKI
jgi:hypothetical protein